ncbi:MAG: hypothetical protein EBV06_03425 [Planctomycetia bacterium]|nr:hypothetical protein [Planctomycetia bacterium]
MAPLSRRRPAIRFLLALGLSLLVLVLLVLAFHRHQLQRHALHYLSQAHQAEQQNNVPRQMTALSHALEFAPNDHSTRSRYGLLLAQQAHSSRSRRFALSTLQTAIRGNTALASARFTAAQLALQLDDAPEALRLLSPLLASDDTSDAETHELHAGILTKLQREEDAARALQSALALDPQRVAAAETLARLYRDNLRRPRRADEVLDHLVNRSSSPASALLTRARFRLADGRTDEAAADLERAAQLDPHHLLVHVAGAELAEQRGNLVAALVRWKTAIKLAPERPELALGLARALRECGQSAEAGTVLDDAYQRLPDHPALVLALAEVCCDQHRLDKAELLRKRLPREAEAASLYLTGLIQQREGMTLEAASTLIEAVKKRTLPPDIEAKALLALCEIYRTAHAHEDRLLAARLARQQADGPFTRYAHGAAALEAGMIDEALEALRAAAQSPRAPAGISLLLARALLESRAAVPEWQRSWGECEQMLTAAEKETSTAAEAVILRAKMLEMRDRFDDALATLREFVRLRPRRLDGWLALVAFLKRRLDPETSATASAIREALQQADHHLMDNPDWLLMRACGASHGPELQRRLTAIASLPIELRDRVEIALAMRWAERRQFANVEPLCEVLLRRRPQDAQVRFLLIESQVARGKDAEAVQQIADLRRREGENGIWWRCAEALRLLRDDPETARRWAAAARDLHPTASRPALLLARLAENDDNTTAALTHYLDAVERGDWSEFTLGRAVWFLTAANRYTDADRLIERAQRRGVTLSSEGGLFRAGSVSDAAVAVSQGCGSAAMIAAQAGRPQRARELALRAVGVRPRKVRDLVWLARVLETAGLISEAETALRRAIELAPDALESHLALIRLLRADRRPDAARRSVVALLATIPPEHRLLTEALAAEAEGRLSDAVAALQRRLRERPGDPEAMRRLTEYYLRLHRLPEAEALLRELLGKGGSAQPEEHARLRRRLALAIASPDRIDEALGWLTLNRQEDGETRADRRVEALIRGNQPKERASAVKELLAMTGKADAVERFQLAGMLEAAGDWPRAEAVLRELASEDADNPIYPAALAAGLERNHKRAEAAQWLQRFKEIQSRGDGK